MLEMVGRSLTELTVSPKLVLVPPLAASATVMVMVVFPNWFGAGVTVTVRLPALPPNTMLPTGTNVGLEELAVKVSWFAEVLSSPMVKGIAAVGVSSFVTRLVMLEMVGAALAEALIYNVKLRLKVVIPSLTETVKREIGRAHV